MPLPPHPSTPPADPRIVSQALVELFEAHATDRDGRIRVEDLLSAASAAAGEACIAAAGEIDPAAHAFTPGAVVMSDRVNTILAADTTDWSGVGESVFGIIRAGALANGYAADECPSLEGVFRGFAAGIAGSDGPGWGFGPLGVPADNRPRIAPLRDAYELRPGVRALFAAHGIPTADWPGICALALVTELARVREAIDHRIALRLVLETVNGLAKTAPVTDEALRTGSADSPTEPPPA